ncbi:MAG TPA: hypothetical protein GXX65_04455 [Methanosarcina sp.]|nr:hypothetical protein [Methanosarcina sp.]
MVNRRNGCRSMFEFKDLVPNPYPAWSTGATVAGQCLSLKILPPIPIRRGQPAQRLRHNGCAQEGWIMGKRSYISTY